jgi:SAM-dependent methyltransferase
MTGEAIPQGFQWTRAVMYEALTEELRRLGSHTMAALEISPGDFWQTQDFKSYKGVSYPQFDVCSQTLPGQFDLIIADQVFEHLLWPYRAARNVYAMLSSGGRFVVTTPFLLRVHDDPVDCSRWTELGLKYLLAEAGFDLDKIRTFSWGNKTCVKANLKHFGWAVLDWRSSLKNDPAYPLVVWAIAQR